MVGLVEELVLLAIEDDGAISHTAGQTGFGMALLGACLVELNSAGRIDADLTSVSVLSPAPTGKPMLDAVLAELATGEKLTIEQWILRLVPMVPELRDKVAGMKKGEVAGPFKSSQGWHVLRLSDLREERTLTREEARNSLVAALRKQKEKETEQAYLREFTNKAGLRFNDEALEKLKGAAD